MLDDVSHAEGGGGLVKNLHKQNAKTETDTTVLAAEKIVNDFLTVKPMLLPVGVR